MGMFDSVYFPCPTKDCNHQIEVQSKAGECFLGQYDPDDVPLAIAADIAGETVYCSKCRAYFVIAKVDTIPTTVKLKLVSDVEACEHCGK